MASSQSATVPTCSDPGRYVRSFPGLMAKNGAVQMIRHLLHFRSVLSRLFRRRWNLFRRPWNVSRCPWLASASGDIARSRHSRARRKDHIYGSHDRQEHDQRGGYANDPRTKRRFRLTHHLQGISTKPRSPIQSYEGLMLPLHLTFRPHNNGKYSEGLHEAARQ